MTTVVSLDENYKPKRLSDDFRERLLMGAHRDKAQPVSFLE
jgi:hypothetical protein